LITLSGKGIAIGFYRSSLKALNGIKKFVLHLKGKVINFTLFHLSSILRYFSRLLLTNYIKSKKCKTLFVKNVFVGKSLNQETSDKNELVPLYDQPHATLSMDSESNESETCGFTKQSVGHSKI